MSNLEVPSDHPLMSKWTSIEAKLVTTALSNGEPVPRNVVEVMRTAYFLGAAEATATFIDAMKVSDSPFDTFASIARKFVSRPT